MQRSFNLGVISFVLSLVVLAAMMSRMPTPSLRAQGAVTAVRDDFTQPDGQPGLDPDLSYAFDRCDFRSGSGCGLSDLSDIAEAPSQPHVLYLYGGASVRVSPRSVGAAAGAVRFQIQATSQQVRSVVITFVGVNGTLRRPIDLPAHRWGVVEASSASPADGGGALGPIRELRVELSMSTFVRVDDLEFASISAPTVNYVYMPSLSN
ncbi:MAG: hypothetical protein OHK0015_46850 [Chloroflexi bacterium OHK40]